MNTHPRALQHLADVPSYCADTVLPLQNIAMKEMLPLGWFLTQFGRFTIVVMPEIWHKMHQTVVHFSAFLVHLILDIFIICFRHFLGSPDIGHGLYTKCFMGRGMA